MFMSSFSCNNLCLHTHARVRMCVCVIYVYMHLLGYVYNKKFSIKLSKIYKLPTYLDVLLMLLLMIHY